MRSAARLATLPLLLALPACTLVEGNPVKEAVNAAGIGPKSVQAPDFIAGSRPPSRDYMPVGVSAPAPRERPRSAEKVKDLQAELEAARGRNAARGGEAERAAKAQKPPAPPAPPPAE